MCLASVSALQGLAEVHWHDVDAEVLTILKWLILSPLNKSISNSICKTMNKMEEYLPFINEWSVSYNILTRWVKACESLANKCRHTSSNGVFDAFYVCNCIIQNSTFLLSNLGFSCLGVANAFWGKFRTQPLVITLIWCKYTWQDISEAI